MAMNSRAAAVVVSLALAMGALAGCAPQVSQHGHTIDADAVARITPGVTSREEVTRLLGTPSALATFENGRWYYVTQRRESRSFFQSRITEQDVVTVSFDDRGIVQAVDRYDMNQAMAIDPSPDTTRTLGNELTVVEQLIGNIGRFGDPASTVGQRQPQF